MSDRETKQESTGSEVRGGAGSEGAHEGGTHPLLALQRSLGNRAVGRMIQRLEEPGPGGAPLDGGTRSAMESSFGQGFGEVRVHTGPEASEAAGTLGARAFTSGNNVVFGANRYRPDLLSGRMLIAHELAHVAQQRNGAGAGSAGAESEAQHAAFDAVAGGRAQVGAGMSGLAMSTLSDAAAKTYAGDNKNKGKVFDLLRSNFPTTSGDPELLVWITANLSGDDMWLATKLFNLGPEPLWDDASITERVKRANDPQHPWDPEQGNIEATIGKSSGLVGAKTSVPIKAYFFPGKTNERAMIIGGIHGSELSGVEVAERLAKDIVDRFNKTKQMPTFTTIIVPQVFPDSVALAKTKPSTKPKDKADGTAVADTDSNFGREIVIPKTTGKGTKTLFPARMFPQQGKHLSDIATGPVDAAGKHLTDDEGKPVPLLPEIEALVKLIERFKPSRIASVHAHRFNTLDHAQDAPGIFVDPRHDPAEVIDPRHKLDPMAAGVSSKHAADDKMTLELAKEAQKLGARVPGNWIGSPKGEVVHYAASGGHPAGASLGDWGPSVGITVVTVEVEHYYDSSQDSSGARAKELEAHSQALMNKFIQ